MRFVPCEKREAVMVGDTWKDRHGVRGLRVAPHVYSTMEEVEVFVRALVEVREQLTGAAGAKL